MDLLFALNYFPTRFADHRRPYACCHDRRPLLDLPLRAEDYDGVVFLYEKMGAQSFGARLRCI